MERKICSADLFWRAEEIWCLIGMEYGARGIQPEEERRGMTRRLRYHLGLLNPPLPIPGLDGISQFVVEGKMADSLSTKVDGFEITFQDGNSFCTFKIGKEETERLSFLSFNERRPETPDAVLMAAVEKIARIQLPQLGYDSQY